MPATPATAIARTRDQIGARSWRGKGAGDKIGADPSIIMT
jgi:hypothetical protein